MDLTLEGTQPWTYWQWVKMCRHLGSLRSTEAHLHPAASCTARLGTCAAQQRKMPHPFLLTRVTWHLQKEEFAWWEILLASKRIRLTNCNRVSPVKCFVLNNRLCTFIVIECSSSEQLLLHYFWYISCLIWSKKITSPKAYC